MMTIAFYVAALVALVATVMVITRLNAIHALLYLIASFLAVGVVFYTLGAPFIAALEIIIYAGAIMVLFVFVIIMLNLGPHAAADEARWFYPRMLTGPMALVVLLLLATLGALTAPSGATGTTVVSPQAVGRALYGPYLLGVELASLILLAGLIGAYHLARRPVGQRGGRL